MKIILQMGLLFIIALLKASLDPLPQGKSGNKTSKEQREVIQRVLLASATLGLRLSGTTRREQSPEGSFNLYLKAQATIEFLE